MNPTELVERVIELGHERLSETLELLHPDAVWILDGERPPLHGHEEIAALRGRRSSSGCAPTCPSRSPAA